MTVDGILIGEELYYHLQVVTTNDCNSIADIHTLQITVC
jgi:hypothetical protein